MFWKCYVFAGFMINQIDTGFLSREPGIMVMNSLNNIDGNQPFLSE